MKLKYKCLFKLYAMSSLCLDVENTKRAYNWFYHGFKEYKNNNLCSPEDIMLMKKMERYLIENGE